MTVWQGAVHARLGLRAPRAGATDGGTMVVRRTVRVLRRFLLLVCQERSGAFFVVERLAIKVSSMRNYTFRAVVRAICC